MLKELSEYAAINGKVHAMLGNRMEQGDFDRMMAMKTVPEIASYLNSTKAWGPCLKGVDLDEVHRAELEKRLRMGLQAEYARLATFASKGMRELLGAMASRAEASELLRFLRFLSAGHPADFAVSLSGEMLKRSRVRFDLLGQTPDYQGLLQAVAGTIYEKALAKAAPEGDFFDYPAAETAVESTYYSYILESVARNFSGKERQDLERYFLEQCDFANIVRLFRLKKYFHVAQEEVVSYLLPYSLQLKGSYLKSLTSAATAEELMELLRQGPYGKVFQQEEHREIEEYAFAFFRSSRLRIRRGKPSAFTALVYLDLKDTELKNIINVIDCVRYQVPASRIPSYLVPVY